MLQTFIITILIILACFILMSIGYIFNGKTMPGSCGNSNENPCECSFAEKLKCKHGLAKESLASDENNIIIAGTNGRNDSKISQRELSAIIEARMKEIFVLTKSEFRRVENECHLNFGVVITGGGSNLENIEDLAMEVFELDAQKGIPNSINGIDDIINNPRYATTIGLIKYIAENNDLKIKNHDDDLDLLDIIKKYYKQFIRYLKLK